MIEKTKLEEISSELPEVLHLSTRVLVMRAGRVAGVLERTEASEERVMELMAGRGGRRGPRSSRSGRSSR